MTCKQTFVTLSVLYLFLLSFFNIGYHLFKVLFIFDNLPEKGITYTKVVKLCNFDYCRSMKNIKNEQNAKAIGQKLENKKSF
jgi:hypothetical protein